MHIHHLKSFPLKIDVPKLHNAIKYLQGTSTYDHLDHLGKAKLPSISEKDPWSWMAASQVGQVHSGDFDQSLAEKLIDMQELCQELEA